MGGRILKIAKRITETAERITLNAHNGDITFNSAKSVKYSAKKDIVFGEYESKEPKLFKSLEFKINIKLVGGKTFVPLGIPLFKGKEENQIIKFEVEVLKSPIEGIKLEIFHNGKIIRSLDCKEEHAIGKHYFGWNGFDDNGIYDSTVFTTGKLRAKVTGTLGGKINERKTDEFSFEYKEVNWVDTIIDKNAKRIDITLRVNLKDGGEQGTEKECYELGKSRNAPIVKICPWDKIPKEAFSFYKKTPIKSTRTKTFEDLKQLTLDGINKYWSRHKGNIGEGVDIDGELYEVFVNAINEVNSEISLNDIPLIYNTNNPWSRSGNPGTSTLGDGNKMDELARLLPDGVVQRISYNVGYIQYSNWEDLDETHWLYKLEGWQYYNESDEQKEFKFTSAHEIGHEILQSFGGTIYSWQHKGSSYYLPQDTKPLGKESFKEEYINRDFMEETSGENYPFSGEIDLMKYYNNSPTRYDYNRVISSEKDVLSLLWLTKIELK
ncbi:hypothetical protein A8C32_07880 [Flavivirga aquatica]|uniref:Uncharacterized protein n=1 Tax=Flavivirga aquatica TaxID=1849968 RepID=A0A1E5SJ47_9FLAO|nr:hypothetical protein [Flavivirga aquatica]OEJ99086.1 hypothetical protein A8C32_07880 [Flavivirga aquatica]